MSRRGSYLGGHTVINGGSGWFSRSSTSPGQRITSMKKVRKILANKPGKKRRPKRGKKPAPDYTKFTLPQLQEARARQKTILRQHELVLNAIYRRIEEIDKAIALINKDNR